MNHLFARALTFVILFLLSCLGVQSDAFQDSDAPTYQPGESTKPQNPADGDDELDSLLDLADNDVGQLSKVKVTAPALQTEVTTVSRQKSTVGRSPAAIFVISNEMIRRSGAREVPEVLRMVPGVQVAKIDASKWAISIRGLNQRFANKLLVQIDGRTVYTPLFGGTFWDVQDLLLEDVDRIEVIRGPGASVWGANAVNGVINIITKKASDTRGVFLSGATGTEKRGFAGARYGWQTEGGADVRVYGKWFERDGGFLPGQLTHDDWRMNRGGFRADWKPDVFSAATFQGDIYDGTTGRESIVPSPTFPFSKRVVDDANLKGFNSLFRYTRSLSEDSDWSIQTYVDQTERQFEQTGFYEKRDTVDLDFQHRFKWGERNTLVWGAGYRYTDDKLLDAPFLLEFDQKERAVDLFSYFVQNEFSIIPETLSLTLGSKFIHSDFTPFEFQPTARLLWTPNERQSIWASYSRAVRIPTRAADDVRITMLQNPAVPGVFPLFQGNRGFVSENLDAWELGMRAQPNDNFSWDFATFFFDYSDVQGTNLGTPFVDPTIPAAFIPLLISNDVAGQSYGFEITSNVQLTEWWKHYATYSLLREDFSAGATSANSSPRNQIYSQTSLDLSRDVQLDLIWRYVDQLPSKVVASYTTMDIRLGWFLNQNTEWSFVGRNLLDSDFPEFQGDIFTGNLATNTQREFYSVLSWRY